MSVTRHLVAWFVLSTTSLVLADAPVHFADVNLKTAVEAELGISDPTPTDMLALTELAARGIGITELTGLEFAVNLRELFLYGNQISGISPLAGLTKLAWLDLDNNQISDISTLAGLTRLTWLDLDDNRISEIAAVSRLTRLTWLDLDNNQISNITALSDLTSLTNLDLGYNQIRDVSVLSRLDHLKKLSLEQNQISDISALSDLTHLSVLWVHDNPLNQQACATYVPQIISNNPGIDMRYDACPTPQHRLSITSTVGGSVALPGQGAFLYEEGTCVAVTALADDACQRFVNWTGSAVDAGAVADPNDPSTILTIGASYTLQANFHNETIYVDDDGVFDPGPYDATISDPHEDGTKDHPFDAIQEAIDAANAVCGRVILVKAGTYREAIDFRGKNIRVTGIDPASTEISPFPVIAAPDTRATVTFAHAEGPGCQLSGFVLTHAHGIPGAAIECLGSSPTVRNCLIVGNRSAGPRGAIVYCQGSNIIIENCTITGNCAGEDGAGLHFVDCGAVVSNSIVWGNRPRQVRMASGSDAIFLYSDVPGTWPGIGNLNADPSFALPGYWADVDLRHTVLGSGISNTVWIDGDYHLMSEKGRWDIDGETWVIDERTSPCVGAGACAWLNLSDPNYCRRIINMGAYGGTVQASLSRAVPIAHWPLDEGTGTTASDTVGGNQATVQGADWTDGILDGALAFDGVDDYVDCGNDPALAPEQFTISLWIYPQASSRSRTVLRKAGGDTDKDYDFELFAARYPSFSFGDGTQSVVLYSGSKLPLERWTHVTLTRDETEAAIYANGAQLLSRSHQNSPSATEHSLIIGGGALQPFKGKIDNVKIYDAALPAEEIKAHFTELE